jgi:arsenate reductase (thioredoxin)
VAKPKVLFLCVHNAGRSQMAAALMEEIAGDSVVVETGGSEPASSIHPNVTATMAEKGIDLTRRPRRFERADVEAADVVITMGCGDECPYVPGKRYEDWQVADPSGQDADTTRAIRDDIEARVRALASSLKI